MKELTMNPGDTERRAPSIKYQPRSKRYYFDVAVGSICLWGEDSVGAYCLLELSFASGMSVPHHTHTREDEMYYVLSGELEVTVGDEVFSLREGDTLIAPRDIPHQLRNSGNAENHYLIMFSPSGSEEFLKVTAVSAPDNAAAPASTSITKRDYGSHLQLPFGMSMNSQPTMEFFLVD